MTTLFSRAVGAASADVDGDLVLVSPTDRRCFALNHTASAVWELLPVSGGVGVSLHTLVERLSQVFDVSGRSVDDEVAHLLERMVDAGVVTTTV